MDAATSANPSAAASVSRCTASASSASESATAGDNLSCHQSDDKENCERQHPAVLRRVDDCVAGAFEERSHELLRADVGMMAVGPD